MDTVAELVSRLQLKAHPEGGYFSETYRSTGLLRQSALPGAFRGDRCYSTAIYYLLPAGTVSRLHRIASDEVWHFYAGGPLIVGSISPEGREQRVTLGADLSAGQIFQHMVPSGHWFGAWPAEGTAFSLVGCTVAPGFDFDDFELANRSSLVEQFPHSRDLITRLTPTIAV